MIAIAFYSNNVTNWQYIYLTVYLFTGTKFTSRYNQEYFFQHLLMNIPFSNLNEIIHPNAENITENLRHFASAVFTNGEYWNSNAKIRESLELECSREEYINTYLSYIDMMRSCYQLYMKGLIIFFHNSLFLNPFDFKFEIFMAVNIKHEI